MAKGSKNGVAKASSRGGQQPAAKSGRAKRARAAGSSQKTTAVGEVVEVTVQARPEQVPAPAQVHELARDLAEVHSQLRAVLRDVKALRAERDATARELGELRERVGVVVKEAAAGLAGVERLRVEAEAAVAHVADLKHVCREVGEELRGEVGEESVALARIRQAREQADEVAAAARETGDRVRAFADECDRTAKAVDALHLQARAAYLESMAEVLKAVDRLRSEVEAVGGKLAELPERIPTPTPAAPSPTSTVPTHEPGNRLGLTVDPGVVVDEILPDGLAAGAGLVRGDVVESVNGQAVLSAAGLRDAVHHLPDGAEISLRIKRGGTPMELAGRLGAADAENRLGLVVAPGVVVAEVALGSPAEAAGIARGDVIERAAGEPVRGGDQLKAILMAMPPGAEVELSALRSGEVLTAVARLDGAPVSP